MHDGGEMQPTNTSEEKYKLAQNVDGGDGGSMLSIQETDGASVDTLKMRCVQQTEAFKGLV